MDNRQLVTLIMERLNINPALVNEGSVTQEQIDAADFDMKEQMRIAMVQDMSEGLLAKTQFADREDDGAYHLRAEVIVFHPQEFLQLVDTLAGAFIERGKMLALPQKMGIIT